MKKAPRILWLTGGLLVVSGLWPVVQLVNRIYPFILGLPLFVFCMLLLNLVVTVFLVIAFRILE